MNTSKHCTSILAPNNHILKCPLFKQRKNEYLNAVLGAEGKKLIVHICKKCGMNEMFLVEITRLNVYTMAGTMPSALKGSYWYLHHIVK